MRRIVTNSAHSPHEMFGEPERAAAAQLVNLALAEDLGERGDITTKLTIPATSQGTVRLVAREHGVLSGLPIVRQVFTQLGGDVQIDDQRRDGDVSTGGGGHRPLISQCEREWTSQSQNACAIAPAPTADILSRT